MVLKGKAIVNPHKQHLNQFPEMQWLFLYADDTITYTCFSIRGIWNSEVFNI